MIVSIFVAGVIFGAFNLAIPNYLYKNIKKDFIRHSSYFLIIQSTAIFIGTLAGAGIINLATKYYNSEFKALIFLFIFVIFFRMLGFLYSLKLQKLEKKDLRFFKYVLLQRPVFYGLFEFTSLSHEEKKMILKLRFKKETLNKLRPKIYTNKLKPSFDKLKLRPQNNIIGIKNKLNSLKSKSKTSLLKLKRK